MTNATAGKTGDASDKFFGETSSFTINLLPKEIPSVLCSLLYVVGCFGKPMASSDPDRMDFRDAAHATMVTRLCRSSSQTSDSSLGGSLKNEGVF
jgi:hypothetical protein